MRTRIREFFIRIFVCRGHHTPTLLEDDETILCVDCGKVLGKKFKFGVLWKTGDSDVARYLTQRFQDKEGFSRNLAEDVAGEAGATHVERRFEIERSFRQAQIAKFNSEKVQKFAHAEHFKRRQPTTARKLWKPGVKVEEEEEP
jgi:hypothetical protein